jgi:hypothetical protein
MDLSSYFRLALTPGNALLPGATVTWLSLHLGWAIVLGAVTLQLASRLPTRGRWTLAGLVLLWTLLPGAASPAFWLGLAFQSPSLMSVVLCLRWCLQRCGQVPPEMTLNTRTCSVMPDPIRHPVLASTGLRIGPAPDSDPGSAMTNANKRYIGNFLLPKACKCVMALGVVLGWVLLLDTLAWFPVSIYAWGFGSAAVALALLAAALLWLLSGSRATVSLLAVLALFVLTRAPSGNLWDALLDPLLWLALQIGWLFNLVRRHSMARRSSPATRA